MSKIFPHTHPENIKIYVTNKLKEKRRLQVITNTITIWNACYSIVRFRGGKYKKMCWPNFIAIWNGRRKQFSDDLWSIIYLSKSEVRVFLQVCGTKKDIWVKIDRKYCPLTSSSVTYGILDVCQGYRGVHWVAAAVYIGVH